MRHFGSLPAFTGNLGNSFVYARPALEVIFERMPATLELAVLAMLIAIVVGIPLGLYAGLRPVLGVSIIDETREGKKT